MVFEQLCDVIESHHQRLRKEYIDTLVAKIRLVVSLLETTLQSIDCACEPAALDQWDEGVLRKTFLCPTATGLGNLITVARAFLGIACDNPDFACEFKALEPLRHSVKLMSARVPNYTALCTCMVAIFRQASPEKQTFCARVLSSMDVREKTDSTFKLPSSIRAKLSSCAPA